MTRSHLPTIVVIFTVSVAPLSAQREAQTASRGAANDAPVRTWKLHSAREARISGVAVTMHEPPRPVPDAPVRLRTTSGKVVGATRTSARGEFEFIVAEPGAYYVELLDDKGRVVAVEDVGETTVSVALGQVSTTIIRVPIPLAQGAWVSAAKAILAAAASSGVAGVTTTGQPASPEQ